MRFINASEKFKEVGTNKSTYIKYENDKTGTNKLRRDVHVVVCLLYARLWFDKVW